MFLKINLQSPVIVAKTVSQNQFLYNSVKLFNRLPCHLSTITETCLFKREFKKFSGRVQTSCPGVADRDLTLAWADDSCLAGGRLELVACKKNILPFFC